MFRFGGSRFPPVHVQSEKSEQAKGSCDNPPSGPRKEQASHEHDSERKRQGQPAPCCLIKVAIFNRQSCPLRPNSR